MIIPLVVALLLIIGGIGFWLYWRHFETTDDTFIGGHVIQMSPNVSATVLERSTTGKAQDPPK
jgi:multidrug resistance efflux pump